MTGMGYLLGGLILVGTVFTVPFFSRFFSGEIHSQLIEVESEIGRTEARMKDLNAGLTAPAPSLTVAPVRLRCIAPRVCKP